jgi:miniconductance mechanosensitive channel
MRDLIHAAISFLELPYELEPYAVQFVLFLFFLILSVIANLIAKHWIVTGLKKLASRTRNRFDDLLVERHVFDRASQFAPAIVLYLGAPVIFPDWPTAQTVLTKLILTYIYFLTARVIDSLINVVSDVLDRHESSSKLPVRSTAQVIKILLYSFTAIIIVAHFLNKSPWKFLSGLGALTAVIMLVFKDSILGFVASMQISLYNMVKPGDWIEVPSHNVDGDVVDVSLNTVKIRNFDKTISTLPTSALVSSTVKNWRGMSESGGRRIKRSIMIDMNTIKVCDSMLLKQLQKIDLLKPYFEEKIPEVEAYNNDRKVTPESSPVNGRQFTNLGAFRHYLKAYLRNHPKIKQDFTLLVRHLPPTEKGLPIELYIFTNDNRWINYEDIQADIFEHILSALSEFELKAFQYPSSTSPAFSE